MLNEFKKFAMRGNVIDLAVGVIIGGAFGKIVTSLVDDIIMPLVGLLLGGVDFSNLYISLGGDAQLKIGSFLQTVVDFLIIAFSIFIFIRVINRFKRKQEEERTVPKVDKSAELLSEIRDLLKENVKSKGLE